MTRRPSKKPLYHKAFADFVAGHDDLSAIAHRYGLQEDVLIRLATAQKWEQRRNLIAGEKRIATVESRLLTQARVDCTLCTATETAASTLAAAYVRLIEEASALPTHPFAEPGATVSANEVYRQERTMIEAKAATMKLATSGLRELIETAQQIGLLKVEQRGNSRNGANGSGDDAPIDLSKLTQLNIAIVQATQGRPAQVLAQLGTQTGEPVNVTATPAA